MREILGEDTPKTYLWLKWDIPPTANRCTLKKTMEWEMLGQWFREAAILDHFLIKISTIATYNNQRATEKLSTLNFSRWIKMPKNSKLILGAILPLLITKNLPLMSITLTKCSSLAIHLAMKSWSSGVLRPIRPPWCELTKSKPEEGKCTNQAKGKKTTLKELTTARWRKVEMELACWREEKEVECLGVIQGNFLRRWTLRKDRSNLWFLNADSMILSQLIICPHFLKLINVKRGVIHPNL